jgi:hypothetical protein
MAPTACSTQAKGASGRPRPFGISEGTLLAGALGYVRLADPVRFRAAWEQAASLRLRAGDASVLAEYDQHGRIIAGEPEQMTDAAAAAYVALTSEVPAGAEFARIADYAKLTRVWAAPVPTRR